MRLVWLAFVLHQSLGIIHGGGQISFNQHPSLCLDNFKLTNSMIKLNG